MVVNPDFSTMLANLITFCILAIMVSGAVAGYLSRTVKPLELPEIIKDIKNDKIKLGYIETVKVVDKNDEELRRLRKEVELLKLKKQLNDLHNQPVKTEKVEKVQPIIPVNTIFNDCVDALIALGEKKSSAKKIAESYFINNPNVKTVDDFIRGVFKK